ncbi:MAG: GAP family protein [Anaerolineae bacterium]|jgi:cytochrome c biogenesis protein CcdA|nr:GAP family protein [Anaerolineae bacterium]
MLSVSLLLTIMAIGLVDSINPALFVAQFYLLTTPRPAGRILSYIAGVLLVNFVGGVLILAGARALVGDVIAGMSLTAFYGLHLAAGVALLLFGLWLRVDTPGAVAVHKPRSLHPWHTFVLGMVVMLNEITSALPYFVAIERITTAQMDTGSNLLALLVYNAVFSLPLFAFLGLMLALRERFADRLERINAWINHYLPRLLKYGSIALGAGLTISSVVALLAG